MIECAVLASGSKGNAVYLALAGHRFLIDCGLSCRAVVERLESVGVSPADIDGLLITHEHDDHIRSAHTFSRRYQVPVLTSEATWRAAGFPDRKGVSFEPLVTGQPYAGFSDVEIFPCPVPHDAVDPVGFIFHHAGTRVTIMTDLGYVTDLVACEAAGSRLLVLESNHDPRMLKMSRYPWELKQRILSRRGHLSNQHAADLVARAVTDTTERVILAHLSEENNHPDIAHMTVLQKLNGRSVDLVVATQDRATPLYRMPISIPGNRI